MTKKLQKLSKEIAAKINKLDDLAGEVRSQFDDFLENISFKNENVEKFYQGIVKSLDKQDSDADMFWFVKKSNKSRVSLLGFRSWAKSYI